MAEAKPSSSSKLEGRQKKVGEYILLLSQQLGSGNYGKVYPAIKQNEKFAVKMIPMKIFNQDPFSENNKLSVMIKNEIDVMRTCIHTNLIRFIEVQQSSNYLYLFLEFCNGGDLKTYCEKKKDHRLSVEEAVILFRKICKGYEVLHNKNILHRDIKLENILLHDGEAKIGDFGFGKVVDGNVDSSVLHSFKCTPIYGSPQVLQQQEYSSKCDIYSLGVLLFKMITGVFPFKAKTQIELIAEQKAIDNKVPFPPNIEIDTTVKDLITKCMRYSESDRLSCKDLMTHELFQMKGTSVVVHIKEDEDKSLLGQSVIRNTKRLLQNDDGVFIAHAGNQVSQAQQNIEKDSQNEQEIQFLNQRNQQQISQKIDKIFLFLRNQGIFSSIVMQNFWSNKASFQFPNYLCNMLVFCLGGYYYYILHSVLNMVDKKAKFLLGDEKELDIYLTNPKSKETSARIRQDCDLASTFFHDVKQSVVKEIEETIAKVSLEEGEKKSLKEFLTFASQCQDFLKFHKYFCKYFDQYKSFISYSDLDHNSLKALWSLMMFYKIEKYLPLGEYQTMDFRKFIEDELSSQKKEQLTHKIQQFYN